MLKKHIKNKHQISALEQNISELFDHKYKSTILEKASQIPQHQSSANTKSNADNSPKPEPEKKEKNRRTRAKKEKEAPTTENELMKECGI